MIYFVFNRASGTYSEEREAFISTRSKLLFKDQVIITCSKRYNNGFIPDIIPDKLIQNDTIVAVGGDGTLNLCLQFIHDNGLNDKVSLGFIPTGTGNNMVKISKLSKNIYKALTILKNKKIKELRYGIINDKKVFLNFSLGFSVYVLQNRTTSSLIGYALDGIKNYFKFKGHEVQMTLDNEVIKSKFFAAFFINTTHYMSFIRFKKENNISNNIEIFYLKDRSKLIILPKLLLLLLGINFFTATTSENLTVELTDGQNVEVDGDIYETKEISLSIKNRFKINFISG
ncbi:MAG: hypothetical protein KAS62_00930 [Candidatus Delongbacteria bacterium]|nr:hypothetical protein [Candidatus Delongbacteria bacterium]